MLEYLPGMLNIYRLMLTYITNFVDDFPSVYKNRFELARYFQSRGDKWLSDHFFQTCLDVSSQEPNGEQRLCEALRFVGLSLEENGMYSDMVCALFHLALLLCCLWYKTTTVLALCLLQLSVHHHNCFCAFYVTRFCACLI